MFGTRCLRINLKSALFIILLVFLNSVQFSNTAINQKETSSKGDIQKGNNSNADILAVNKSPPDASSCNIGLNCDQLPIHCYNCNYNFSCLYGQKQQVACEIRSNIVCNGDRVIERSSICRYCWQTASWEHYCTHRVDCHSVHQTYITNCSVNSDLFCLGNRQFQKRIRCNWTHGYKWSTALIISIALGGFGADRFYLGHWQEGIGKLFSFGGLGVWTLIDATLISLHYLGPADGSLYL